MKNLHDFLKEYCFSISLNSNDTFAYACADSTNVDISDLSKLMEMEEKYSADGVNAFSSCVYGAEFEDVIKPWQTENYFKALEELKGYRFHSRVSCYKDYHSDCYCECKNE